MTTNIYIVTNTAGANLRQHPSTSYPSTTPAGYKAYLDTISVINDWTAVNGVGSETNYLPVLVDGRVLYVVSGLLSPAGLATALTIANVELGNKGGGTYIAWYNSTAAGKSDPKPTSEAYCTVGALWALAKAGVDVSAICARTAEKARQRAAKVGLWHAKSSSYTPKSGDLVQFHANGTGNATHTELLVSKVGDTIKTINFNSGGVVKAMTRKVSDSYTYGYIEV